MKNKVRISKINIKIGDKEISLSLDEAQELRQILDETFGKRVIYPYQPLIIERPVVRPWQWWESPTITCGTSGNVANFTLTSGNTVSPLPVS